MRHGKKFNHLGRKKGHRKALLMNLSVALLKNKRIFTTLAKAKALRKHIEPLITKCKTNTTHNRRVVFSYLQDKESVKELFENIAQKIGDRPGGYTRVVKMGFRQSDSAEMAMIELVDFNELMESASTTKGAGESTKKKRTRRGRTRKGSSANSATAAAAVATLGASDEEE